MKLTKKTSTVQRLLDNPIVWKSELKPVPIPIAAKYVKPSKLVKFKASRALENSQYESENTKDQPTGRVRRFPERKRKQKLIPDQNLDDEEVGFDWDPDVNHEKDSSPDPDYVNYEKKAKSDPDFNIKNEIESDSDFQYEYQYNSEDSDSGNEVRTKKKKKNPVVVLERLPSNMLRGVKLKKAKRRRNRYRKKRKRRDSSGNPIDSDPDTEELIPCPHCPYQFESEEKLQKHAARHKAPLVPCPKCGKLVKDGVFLKYHLRFFHKRMKGAVRQFPCPIPDCETAYLGLNRMTLNDHIRRLHPTYFDQFMCPTCSKRFLDQEGLDRHIQAHHSSHPCDLCGKVFSSK